MIGRTHGVHAEPMTFGLKLALWYAELRATSSGCSAHARSSRSARSRARSGRSRICPVDRSGGLPEARAGAGAGLLAGHPARSPRRAAVRARDYRRVAGEVRARDSRAAEDGDRRSRGAVRQRAEGLVGDAAQAQSDRLRADCRASRGCCAATRTRRSRTSRSGTSATSRTRRSSASFCPTVSSCSTTCCGASRAS